MFCLSIKKIVEKCAHAIATIVWKRIWKGEYDEEKPMKQF